MTVVAGKPAGHESSAAPSVCLLVLNWNTGHYLRRFLPALEATTYANKRIYVIDNNSKDDSLAILARDFPSVGVIRLLANEGYASGYNRALAQLEADYFVLVNSDIEVEPGFLEPVIAMMEKDPAIGICQPKLLSIEERNKFEYAGAAGGWIDRLGLPFARGRVLLAIEEDEGQYDDPVRLFWASGACMFMKSSVYRTVGGFYDYYYMHQEDIDLCWRAQRAGIQIWSCPQSRVYHIGGGSLSWQDHLKTFLTYRNNYIMLSRNLRSPAREAILALRMLTDTAGIVFFFVTGKPGIASAMLRAIFGYLYWLIAVPHRKNYRAPGLKGLPGVYGGTILIPYFLRNRRKFSEIVRQ